MVFTNNKRLKKNNKIKILRVDKKREKDYIYVFKTVFCEGEGVYGGLSTDYLEALKKFFKNYPRSRRINFVAYMGEKPVATTTFLFNKKYALIIGVAVLSEFRNKNIAKTLVFKGIDELKNKGKVWKSDFTQNKIVFLGTEAGTENEKIYEKMGFETKIIENIYVKKEV